MNWLALAILGHLLNAVSFVVDKSLLSTTFKRSATYAALMGMVSILLVVAAPFVRSWPPVSLYPFVIGFGGFFVFALWAFFEALSRSEPSRVVPIVGSFIPLFTLVGSIAFFHDRLRQLEFLGFVLLLLATWILTQEGGHGKGMDRRAMGMSFLAAFLFAAASLCGKYAFDRSDFLGVLVLSRMFTAVIGLMIGIFWSAETRHELMMLRQTNKNSALPWYATFLAIGGQLMGGIGFVLVHLSMAHGNAAIVNALQAVQYAALVLVAWFGGVRLRTMLQETVAPKIIFAKSIAIVMVAIGLGLISRV